MFNPLNTPIFSKPLVGLPESAHLLFGTSPVLEMMPQIAIDLNKHIQEHVTLKAEEAVAMQLEQAEAQMGQSAEGDVEPMVQSQIAVLEAQFMGEVKQQQAELSGEGQPDPVIQLKQQELQQRALRDQADKEYDFGKLNLDQQKLAQKDKIDNEKIQSQEDIAQLRANVNLKKMNMDRTNMRVRDAFKDRKK